MHHHRHPHDERGALSVACMPTSDGPPYSSTICFAIDRPRPSPSAARVISSPTPSPAENCQLGCCPFRVDSSYSRRRPKLANSGGRSGRAGGATGGPVGVFGAVDGGLIGSALDVVDAGRGGRIVGVGLGWNRLPRVGGVRERIDRNLPDVAVGDERVERAGILPLVRVVLIDRVPQIEQDPFSTPPRARARCPADTAPSPSSPESR